MPPLRRWDPAFKRAVQQAQLKFLRPPVVLQLIDGLLRTSDTPWSAVRMYRVVASKAGELAFLVCLLGLCDPRCLRDSFPNSPKEPEEPEEPEAEAAVSGVASRPASGPAYGSGSRPASGATPASAAASASEQRQRQRQSQRQRD